MLRRDPVTTSHPAILSTTVALHTMLVIVALESIAVGLTHVERAEELSPTLIGFYGRVLPKPRA